MIEPQRKSIVQKGFAKTAKFLLSRQFDGLYLDKDSAWQGQSSSKSWPTPAELLAKVNGGSGAQGARAEKVFIFSSHSSWWDPLVAAYLSVHLWNWESFAPMEEKVFKSQLPLRYTGIFGVDRGDGTRVAAVLNKHMKGLSAPALWVTPQGIFHPNEWPQPLFRQAVGYWAKDMRAAILPVAIHYAFGPDQKPNVFVRVGDTLNFMSILAAAGAAGANEASESIKSALAECQKKLSAEINLLLERIYHSQQGTRSCFDENFDRLL